MKKLFVDKRLEIFVDNDIHTNMSAYINLEQICED